MGEYGEFGEPWEMLGEGADARIDMTAAIDYDDPAVNELLCKRCIECVNALRGVQDITEFAAATRELLDATAKLRRSDTIPAAPVHERLSRFDKALERFQKVATMYQPKGGRDDLQVER